MPKQNCNTISDPPIRVIPPSDQIEQIKLNVNWVRFCNCRIPLMSDSSLPPGTIEFHSTDGHVMRFENINIDQPVRDE